MPVPESLSLIIQSDEPERVYYGLVMAAATLALGKPVTLLFTMGGTRALTAGWSADGAVSPGPGTAGYEELLSSCVDLGGRFLVCELGLRFAGLTAADLREDIPSEVGSAVTFLSASSPDGAMLYI